VSPDPSGDRLQLELRGTADTTPPVITPTTMGTAGENGFYTSDVQVSWSSDDAILTSEGCDTTTIDADTAGQTLTCSVGSAGGVSEQSVTIKRDATAPQITAPESRSEAATGPGGAAVSWDATAADGIDGSVDVMCTPASGSTFAIGDTMVECTSRDTAGNAAAETFVVHVTGEDEQIGELKPAIADSSLPEETAASATKLLEDAKAALADGAKASACGKLGAVANKIRAKSGKEISEDAAAILADLDRIEAVVDC